MYKVRNSVDGIECSDDQDGFAIRARYVQKKMVRLALVALALVLA